MRKAVRILSGIVLITVGFLLALPLVPGPGIPLILVGLIMLADYFPWARRLVDWVKARYATISGKNRAGESE
jgi:hypothetical protein